MDSSDSDKAVVPLDIDWETKLAHMNRAFKRRRLERQAGLRGNASDAVSSSLHIFAENGHAITDQAYMPPCSGQRRNKRRGVRKRALNKEEKNKLQEEHYMWSTLLSSAQFSVANNVTTQVAVEPAPGATHAVDAVAVAPAPAAAHAVEAAPAPAATHAVDAVAAAPAPAAAHAVEAAEAAPALGLPTTGLKTALSLEHQHSARHPPDATSVQYDPLLPKNDVQNLSNVPLSALCVDRGSNPSCQEDTFIDNMLHLHDIGWL